MASHEDHFEVVIHKVFELPPGQFDKCLAANMSVWVCIGPFQDDDRYHAADHSNAVAICRSLPQEKAGEISAAIELLLSKLSIRYAIEEYPGD